MKLTLPRINMHILTVDSIVSLCICNTRKDPYNKLIRCRYVIVTMPSCIARPMSECPIFKDRIKVNSRATDSIHNAFLITYNVDTVTIQGCNSK